MSVLPAKTLASGLARRSCANCAVAGQRRVLRQSQQRLFNGRSGKPLGRRGKHLLPGVQDRPVAGAAAQVARQVVGQLLAAGHGAGLAVLFVASPQAHHKAGRAKTALRTVAGDQALLHRVQLWRLRRGVLVHRGNLCGRCSVTR
jgi:hypothetical protein